MVQGWWLYAFVGGGLGSVARAGLSSLGPAPWSTVAVNLLGSALLAALAHPAVNASPALRMFVGVGVLGGFTTYSTFNLQVFQAVQARDYGNAALQVALTVAGALVVAVLTWMTLDLLLPGARTGVPPA